MGKFRVETIVICNTFNENKSLKKTAQILGYNIRTIRRRIDLECDYYIKPKNIRETKHD